MAYLWIKTDALDHKKSAARDRINKWQRKVITWYSITSKKTQMEVPTPSTIPLLLLFLHNKISAAARDTCNATQ
ncbi:hypothetical protein CR513_30620, partial [Mucuna pruriens]